jgi:hypothetical protein
MNFPARSNHIRKSLALAFGFFGLIAAGLVASGLSIQASQPQKNEPGLRQFVGTWEARFKGKIFETVKLEERQGKLVGSIRGAKIQLDKDGELISAHAIDSNDPSPIADASLTSGILRIITKEKDSEDTIQFEMKLTAVDQAELRLLVPPEVTAPKPWKLERTSNGK